MWQPPASRPRPTTPRGADSLPVTATILDGSPQAARGRGNKPTSAEGEVAPFAQRRRGTVSPGGCQATDAPMRWTHRRVGGAARFTEESRRKTPTASARPRPRGCPSGRTTTPPPDEVGPPIPSSGSVKNFEFWAVFGGSKPKIFPGGSAPGPHFFTRCPESPQRRDRKLFARHFAADR